MRTLLYALASAAALAFATPAFAEPTDIVNVPTADVRDRGQVYVALAQELYRDQSEDSDDKRTNIYTSLGVLPRLEVGLDVNDVTNETVLEGDVKYQISDPDRARLGLAVGAYNIGSDDDDLIDGNLVGYGVATGREGRASLTLGVGASEETVGVLFGATYDVQPRLQIFADYDDAQDLGRASIGAAWRATPGLQARAYYTDGEDDLQVIRLELALSARLLGA